MGSGHTFYKKMRNIHVLIQNIDMGWNWINLACTSDDY